MFAVLLNLTASGNNLDQAIAIPCLSADSPLIKSDHDIVYVAYMGGFTKSILLYLGWDQRYLLKVM